MVTALKLDVLHRPKPWPFECQAANRRHILQNNYDIQCEVCNHSYMCISQRALGGTILLTELTHPFPVLGTVCYAFTSGETMWCRGSRGVK